MSTAETASCLDLTQETVKVRLLRARQMIREELYAQAGATSSQAFQFLGPRGDRIVGHVFDELKAIEVSLPFEANDICGGGTAKSNL